MLTALVMGGRQVSDLPTLENDIIISPVTSILKMQSWGIRRRLLQEMEQKQQDTKVLEWERDKQKAQRAKKRLMRLAGVPRGGPQCPSVKVDYSPPVRSWKGEAVQ